MSHYYVPVTKRELVELLLLARPEWKKSILQKMPIKRLYAMFHRVRKDKI